MSNYEFTRLADVETVETVSDTANVLVEEDGEIKKVAKSQVGGSTGKPVIFYPTLGGLAISPKAENKASAETILDAYYAGNAYIYLNNIGEDTEGIQRIYGFYVSGLIYSQPGYGSTPVGTYSNICTKEEYAAYLNKLLTE